MNRYVVLIAGPPGSGKTTRARALAADESLEVYDLDDEQWTGGERAFRAALAALADDPGARAVVIRSCSTAAAWHATVAMIDATQTLLLDPGPETCRQRITHDTYAYSGRTWSGSARRLAGVGAWYQAHQQEPWHPPRVTLPPSREW